MAIPLRQRLKLGAYLARQQLARRKQFPLIVELEPLFAVQPGVRGLREDPVPDRGAAPARAASRTRSAAMEESGAPMVSIAGGEPLLHPEIGRDGGRAREAEAVRVPLHERDPAEAQDRPVHAVAVLLVRDPRRRAARAPRRARSAATASSTSASRRSSAAKSRGLPGHDEQHVLQHRLAEDGARGPRLPERRARGRRDDGLARLRVREGARPGALPRRRADATAVPRRRSPTGGARSGG